MGVDEMLGDGDRDEDNEGEGSYTQGLNPTHTREYQERERQSFPGKSAAIGYPKVAYPKNIHSSSIT